MPMPQYNGPMYAQGPAAVGPYNLQGYQQTFGYNPQQTYMPQTQQPQMAAQQPQTPSLVGRIVTANDQIPPAEIPSNAELRSQVQALNLAASQSNQNTYLVNKLQPCPTPAYVVPNPNACYQGCGYSNGCGC